MLFEMTSIWFWYAVKPVTPMNNESNPIDAVLLVSRAASFHQPHVGSPDSSVHFRSEKRVT
jgi:hypothetical protein